MNFRTHLLVFLALIAVGICPSRAATPTPPDPRAHVYVVYSGTLSDSIFEYNITPAPETISNKIYLVIDLADWKLFTIMQADTVSSPTNYSISTRLLENDGSESGINNGYSDSTVDPVRNFIWSLSAPKPPATQPSGGQAIFRFTWNDNVIPVTANSQTEYYPYTLDLHGTGPLTGFGTAASIIVAANTKAKKTGIYTVNPVSPAVSNFVGTTGSYVVIPYTAAFTGVNFRYAYDPRLNSSSTFKPLYFVNTAGSVTLKLDPTLTALANVGGSYLLKGQTTPVTINPVAGPIGPGNYLCYEKFLYQIALSLGIASSYVPTE